MTGVALLLAGGAAEAAAGSGPPPPLQATLSWGGSAQLEVSGASGSSASIGIYNYQLQGYEYPYRFLSHQNGGVEPLTDEGTTVTYNPSGKLGIAPTDNSHIFWATWNGMNLNETEVMEIFHMISDDSGATATATISLTIKRTS